MVCIPHLPELTFNNCRNEEYIQNMLSVVHYMRKEINHGRSASHSMFDLAHIKPLVGVPLIHGCWIEGRVGGTRFCPGLVLQVATLTKTGLTVFRAAFRPISWLVGRTQVVLCKQRVRPHVHPFPSLLPTSSNNNKCTPSFD